MSLPRSRREHATPVDPSVLRSTRATPGLLAQLPRLPGSPTGRVIRASDNTEVFEVEQALALAKAETKQLKVDISSAIDQGREEGYVYGKAQANEELAAEIHRVQHQLTLWQADARETIVDLAVKIAGKLVRDHDIDELTRNGIVKEVAARMNDAPYTLQVASNMVGSARDAMKQLQAEHPKAPTPTLRLDTRLPEGRAVLVTRFGSIDLDLDAQLEAIRRSLLAEHGASA
jgi:type III secretion protein L